MKIQYRISAMVTGNTLLKKNALIASLLVIGKTSFRRRGEELEKAQEYAERTTPEKPSIRERLEDAKRECAEHKPQEGKKPGRDVPEHDCL